MSGRREHATLQFRDASSRLDEVEGAIESDALLDAQAPVEIEQVYAAAHEYVLAVIDQLSGFGLRIGGLIGGPRCGSPSQKSPRFEDLDFELDTRQGSRGREAREAAADDDYLGQVYIMRLRAI